MATVLTSQNVRDPADTLQREPDAVVEVIDVRKRFGAVEALRGVSLTVRRQETVCIIGPSGSGKSTLLRCINHLERIDGGRVFVAGHPIGYRPKPSGWVEDSDRNTAKQRQEIGMVFQRFNLFPHLTVIDNVTSGPRWVRHTDRASAVAIGEQLLERVGLLDKRDEYPAFLSGGQQQRVAIARALAMRPAVMLFDEPTSALDAETVREVLDVMRELALDGTTMLVATHELGFAREVATRIAMMDEGLIVEEAPPALIFSDRAQPRTQAFISDIL